MSLLKSCDIDVSIQKFALSQGKIDGTGIPVLCRYSAPKRLHSSVLHASARHNPNSGIMALLVQQGSLVQWVLKARRA